MTRSIWKGPYLQLNKLPIDPWSNDLMFYVIPGRTTNELRSLNTNGKGTRRRSPNTIGNWADGRSRQRWGWLNFSFVRTCPTRAWRAAHPGKAITLKLNPRCPLTLDSRPRSAVAAERSPESHSFQYGLEKGVAKKTPSARLSGIES